MVGVADDITALGAEIIWVLERTASNQPGTAANCVTFMNAVGGGTSKGWCVGDSQSATTTPAVSMDPTPYVFDNSPFSIGRGFDMIVDANTMEILFSSSHGSPTGNQNLTGADILAEVQAIITPPVP